MAESNWLPDRHRIQVTLTLAPDFPLDEVEREALEVMPSAHVLRVDYAGHDQSIVLTARGDNNTSLPAIAESLRLLAGVKQDQWGRVGTHETAGPLSVDDFVRRLAQGNDEAHLRQIEAIKRRFAILGTLEAGPRELAEATRGLSDEALRRRPASG